MKRTKEHEMAIISRIKLIMKEKELTQKQLEQIIGVSQANITKYLSNSISLGDGFIYTLIHKLYINPLWLEYGEGDVYLSPHLSSEAKNNDNNEVTISREVFNVIANQAAAIKSQQDIIHNYIEENNERKSFKTCIG